MSSTTPVTYASVAATPKRENVSLPISPPPSKVFKQKIIRPIPSQPEIKKSTLDDDLYSDDSLDSLDGYDSLDCDYCGDVWED